MKTKLRVSLILLGLTAMARAGTVADDVLIHPPEEDPGWTFRVEPYGWLTGLNGQTGLGPFIADIDQSFSDIFHNLDMAAAMQVEARKGRLGILADGFYADLGGSGNAPGPFYDEVDVDIRQFMGELAVAWRVYESPRAFIDLYAGARYNDLSVGLTGTPDPAGNRRIGETVADRVVSSIGERVDDAVSEREAEFQAASAAARDTIRNELRSTVLDDARDRVKRDIVRNLGRFGRRDRRLESADRLVRVVTAEVKAESLALAKAHSQLAVARLRASANAALQSGVAKAQTRVDKAEAALSKAIGDRISANLPSEGSADVNWIDPFIGIRAQYHLTEKWHLAGKSDIGGFGVGSELAWSMQATVGYQISESVSTEVGYRYLDTDYTDGAFVYDMASHGLYLGLNVRF